MLHHIANAAVDKINLTSTIMDEDYILWPNEEVVFTCETRGPRLIHKWTSDDYIGDGISLTFDNRRDDSEVQSGSRYSAILKRVDYNYVMVSQLRITTSSLFQTSTVACTNSNKASKSITFSVLSTLYIIHANHRVLRLINTTSTICIHCYYT